MGDIRANMFNRKASNPKSKPDRVIRSLSLETGQNIADIGAGGGYFAFRFAKATGMEGIVYAVDTNRGFLKFIDERCRSKGIRNVQTVHANEILSSLPKKGLDLVFLRNVYHHLPKRIDYFRKIRKVLKPDGRIAILEYLDDNGLSFHSIFGHNVPREIIIREMTKAGFELGTSYDFLTRQSFLIFLLKEL